MADFVMVSALVSFLFLGLLQLGFTLHVRNTLTAAAAEGARLGARADAVGADGVARTRDLVTRQLSARFAGDITAAQEVQGGVTVDVIRVTAPLPVIGPLGVGRDLRITARAFSERQ